MKKTTKQQTVSTANKKEFQTQTLHFEKYYFMPLEKIVQLVKEGRQNSGKEKNKKKNPNQKQNINSTLRDATGACGICDNIEHPKRDSSL